MPKRIVDWEKVKRDFLFTEDTLHKVAKKWHLTNPCIYKHAKQDKWKDQKVKFAHKVTRKISTEVMGENVKQWHNQIKLWRDIEYQAAKILKQYSGENKPAIKPSRLVNLAFALNISLKSQKLIHGESTENISTESHYKSIVWLLEKRRRERERIVDAERIGPESTGRGQMDRDIRRQAMENTEPI